MKHFPILNLMFTEQVKTMDQLILGLEIGCEIGTKYLNDSHQVTWNFFLYSNNDATYVIKTSSKDKKYTEEVNEALFLSQI